MGISDLIRNIGQASKIGGGTSTPVDVIEFAESDWGLGKADPMTGKRFRLFPIQKIILKVHYGLELDDNDWGVDLDEPIPIDHPAYYEITNLVGGDDPEARTDDYGYYAKRIKVTDWRRKNIQYMTEAGYLRYLHKEGRCNIAEVDGERRELILSIGRRSGKTLIASVISAYETYKLLLKHDPHGYYGVASSNPIHIVSVATDREQAGLLYKEVSGHFQGCEFFSTYMAHSTQSFASFQTPRDIDKYGRYEDNQQAKASIIVTFKSCIAKSVRGMGMIVAIMDEMAHFNDEGQSSAADVYDAIRPATAAYSKKHAADSQKAIGPVESRIVAISSPMGRQGKFYELFQAGMKGGASARNMLCIQAPTWEVNPTIPASEFEDAYMKDPNVFDTEFGGMFSDRTKGWLEHKQDLYDCIDPGRRPNMGAPARMPHFLSLDLALVNDYTGVAIGHLENTDDRGPVVVIDYVDRIHAGQGKYEHRERLEFDDVVDWIYKLSRQFFIAHGVFDQHCGLPFEQAVAKRGLTQLKMQHFTDVLNSDAFKNFKDLMWNKQLVLYDWPIPDKQEHCDYIEELCELQAEYKTKNIVKVHKPNVEGKSDDMSDALVRMIWLASQHMASPKYITGTHSGGGFGGPRSYAGIQAKAMAAARRMGSSPDRQQHRLVRGRIMGR